MFHGIVIFILFLCLCMFSWFVSYSDFEELLVCYGCNQIESTYDFIIVGGGTAGCVIAKRLSENSSTSIVILEAGGKGNKFLSIPVAGPMLQMSNFDWKYTTTRQTGACMSFHKQRCKFPVGKILGGTHQMNNMLYTRGHPQDYADWFEDLPGYTYEKEVEEYFNRAEHYYEVNETVNETMAPALLTPVRYSSIVSTVIMKAFNSLGFSSSRPTQKYFGGFYKPLVTQKNGRRWTTADHLLEVELTNVDILTKARADQIIFNETLDAEGVKFNYLGDDMFVKARRAVIICAGTVGSAKLLMLSGIGPKEHLEKLGIEVLKDLRVGDNLQDHLTTGFDLMIMKKPLGITLKDLMSPSAWVQYFFHDEGVWTCNGVDLIGFANIDYVNCKNRIQKNSTQCYQNFSQKQPDIEYMMLPLGLTSDYGLHLRSLIGVTDEVWDKYFAKIEDTAMTILPVLLHPKSRGTIRLANKNPNSKPLIDPNYLSHPYDMKMLLSFIMQLKQIFDKTHKHKVDVNIFEHQFPGCEKHEFGTYCYWDCYLRRMSTTSYHPIGTCKMGVTNDSVVDFDYQVHGTNRLFVADGSVLPSQISGHIMGPIIMMAERAAEFLKKFHGFEMSKTKPR